MTPLAIAIILSCQGVPVGVMTRDNGIQRSYNIVTDAQGIVTVEGLTNDDDPVSFHNTMRRAKVLGVETEYLRLPDCEKDK